MQVSGAVYNMTLSSDPGYVFVGDQVAVSPPSVLGFQTLNVDEQEILIVAVPGADQAADAGHRHRHVHVHLLHPQQPAHADRGRLWHLW